MQDRHALQWIALSLFGAAFTSCSYCRVWCHSCCLATYCMVSQVAFCLMWKSSCITGLPAQCQEFSHVTFLYCTAVAEQYMNATWEIPSATYFAVGLKVLLFQRDAVQNKYDVWSAITFSHNPTHLCMLNIPHLNYTVNYVDLYSVDQVMNY